MQSSPVEQFTTRVTSADTWIAAAGADVIVVADDGAASREQAGEAGLAVMREIARVASNAPLLFAGASQRELMARVSVELQGAAAAAHRKRAARARVRGPRDRRVLLDASGVDVTLRVVGVPPQAAVVAWEHGSAVCAAADVAARGASDRRASTRGSRACGRPARTRSRQRRRAWSKRLLGGPAGATRASSRSSGDRCAMPWWRCRWSWDRRERDGSSSLH